MPLFSAAGKSISTRPRPPSLTEITRPEGNFIFCPIFMACVLVERIHLTFISVSQRAVA